MPPAKRMLPGQPGEAESCLPLQAFSGESGIKINLFSSDMCEPNVDLDTFLHSTACSCLQLLYQKPLLLRLRMCHFFAFLFSAKLRSLPSLVHNGWLCLLHSSRWGAIVCSMLDHLKLAFARQQGWLECWSSLRVFCASCENIVSCIQHDFKMVVVLLPGFAQILMCNSVGVPLAVSDFCCCSRCVLACCGSSGAIVAHWHR
jgi:hypothetical protein